MSDKGARLPLALVAVGFGLLLVAWSFSTAPFGAPDEAAHYLRATNIAQGHLLGPKAVSYAATPQQTAFIEHDSRGVLVSAAMAPPGARCTNNQPVPRTGRCVVASYEGNFQPLPYLLPAVAIGVSHRANTALWLGRVASVLPCVGFILLAFALLWTGSLWSVLGLLAAITPSTLFIESVINPNGLELAANLAFVASLLRISRQTSESPRWVWAAAGISGAVTILAWQLGWVFVGAELALIGGLFRAEALRALARDRRREALCAAGAVGMAFLIYLGYGVHADLLHSGFGISPLGSGLRQGVTQLRINLFGAIALFGLLNVALPSDAYYWIWFVLVLGLLAGGLILGTVRERVVVVLATVVALLFPILFYAWVQRHSGFGLQPRHVMPLLALMPMLGAEIIFRHRDRLTHPRLSLAPRLAIACLVCFQLFGWVINARSAAGVNTGLSFLSHAAWSPPLGWITWAVVAVAGTATLLMLPVWGLRRAPARAG